jgi:co-chaperonin GroES (HSP10)
MAAPDLNQLPNPVGYKLLCALPEIEETYGSGIVKASTTINAETITSVVMYVVKVGPDAYKDPHKFPYGPWAKEGDFIVCRAYSGTRVKLHGKPYVLINDDMVEATVEDPRGLTRA